MKGHEHTDKADEFAAEAREPLGQDAAAAWAAVAAWAADAHADRNWPEISPPGISPPGVPKPRLPGIGPLPGP